ncbi:MAG: alpha/beta fold hydrolase [Gaiella sp.]
MADAPRVVCLHGVTGWGGHFAALARDALADRRVLAPDLLGHGASPAEPPWTLAAQREAILATVGETPATWIGHSLGGRLAAEIALARPELVERLVLLDPAIIPGRGQALLAFAEDARTRRSYMSFDALVDARFQESMLTRAPRELVAQELRGHSVERADGRWEYRFVQAAVVTSFAELATDPPQLDGLDAPTLLVAGAASYVPVGELVPDLTAALGERLELVTVPGGHTVLWDALPETTAAVTSFLGR